MIIFKKALIKFSGPFFSAVHFASFLNLFRMQYELMLFLRYIFIVKPDYILIVFKSFAQRISKIN
jgi:hypothetical protein